MKLILMAEATSNLLKMPRFSMRKQDNYTFLTTAPIRRVIPAMAVPTIISMLVTSIYNLVDTYFVGLINT